MSVAGPGAIVTNGPRPSTEPARALTRSAS